MTWFIVFLAVVALVGLAPKLIENRRAPRDDSFRAQAPGEFAALSQGLTHYRWVGPVRGPVAVLIHGLNTPSTVWNEIADGLGEIGYRVLVYDLYGRGFSDAPAGAQTSAFFLQQLDDILADQELADDLTIVGYSMGGSIATAFAAANPHRMKRLILIGSGGVKTQESEFTTFCRTRPLIGDWVHGLLGGRRMKAAIAHDPAAKAAPDIASSQRAEIGRRGFLPAVLSSRRGILSDLQDAEHRKIGREGIPVLAIWGEKDTVIPIKAIGVLAQWNRAARQEMIEGADHAMPYSHTEETLAHLREMLRDTH